MFGTSVTSPGTNLPQQDVPSNKISIEKSSDILIGSKTQFNGNVVIQNFIAGNDGQNSIIPNHNPDSLQEPQNGIILWFIQQLIVDFCRIVLF